MAHSLSAQKRVRQNQKRRLRNKQIKSRVKTAVKTVRQLINKYEPVRRIPPKAGAGGPVAGDTKPDIGPINSSLRRALKVLDKAASSGVIHKNRASRVKSRLCLAVNKISQT